MLTRVLPTPANSEFDPPEPPTMLMSAAPASASR